jgi:hypothetical protein
MHEQNILIKSALQRARIKLILHALTAICVATTANSIHHSLIILLLNILIKFCGNARTRTTLSLFISNEIEHKTNREGGVGVEQHRRVLANL